MRRRGLLLALPLGAVALGSCDPNAPAPPEDPPGSGAGTESDGRPDIAVDPEPTLIGEFADPVDPTTVRLPLEMGVMIVVDPGWTAMPQVLDGIFLGYEEVGDDAGGADGEDGATALTALTARIGSASPRSTRTAPPCGPRSGRSAAPASPCPGMPTVGPSPSSRTGRPMGARTR